MHAPSLPAAGVVIGLGANLGDPEAQLREAARALDRRVGVLRASSLFLSAPIGPDQPDFLNAAVLVDHPGPLPSLLQLTRDIEEQLGRTRAVRWGPRLVDLDLLWAATTTSDLAELTVPHPELTQRAFALLPLLELCPEAREPRSGTAYRDFLPGVHSQRIAPVHGPEWWLDR